jgi:hypothetical protein
LRGRSSSAQELLAKQVSKYDDAELCKLLLEISLSDSAYQRGTASRDDVLIDTAKRYRVDSEKLHKTVAKELATTTRKENKQAKDSQDAGLNPSIFDLWRNANSYSVLFCS